MIIQTKYHDKLDVAEQEVLAFQEGIPGFNEEKEFIILPLSEEIQVLQSVKTRDVAFVLVIPFLTEPSYEFTLDDAAIEQLQIEKPEDAEVYSIMSVKEPFQSSTINLAAPVVVNRTKRLGKQVILNDSAYSIRTPLQKSASGQKG
ncbi:flagellar assembly protein FliW [Peribacillus sp. SCS-37]|uniref:flagellar assembly protein FliW n=1 Tax=Paraperibacillus esterisolvens TaxID=3115296 RepID=UPI00390605B3